MDSLFTDSAFIEGCIWVKSEKKNQKQVRTVSLPNAQLST